MRPSAAALEPALRVRRAALLVTAPLWLVVLDAAASAPPTATLWLPWAGAVAAALLQTWGARACGRGAPATRWLLATAAATGSVAVLGSGGATPLPTALLLLALVLGGSWALRGSERQRSRSAAAAVALAELRAAVAALALLWVIHALVGAQARWPTFIALAWAWLAAVHAGQAGARAALGGGLLPAVTVGSAWAVGLAGALQWHADPFAASTWMLLGPLVTLGWSRRHHERAVDLSRSTARAAGALDGLLLDPARLMLTTFAVGGVAGGLLLALPASARATAIAPLDALFTAFSALCVTGLSVRDTALDFSAFGQVVILGLIQIGGLGILTFSTGALLLARQRLSLRHERAVAESVGAEHRGEGLAALWRVLVVTFGVEACAAAALAPAFAAAGDSWPTALWRAVFTAVSAFCNAGFALQSDSLIGYAASPWVMHVVAVTIILGGLGPATVALLPGLGRRRLPLPAALALTVTALALVVPAAVIAVLEWDHALAPLAAGDRIHNAWFQSVTTRTAGFNSIALDQLRPATWTLMLILMFLGGSPASTAGGIKTTTLAVLAVSMFAALRGRDEARAFGFRLSQATVMRAGAVATAGVVSVVGLVFALQLTQQMPLHWLIFEAVSALGTVGLSMGGTALLDDVGKVLIILAMYAGRVGPLTVFWLLEDPAPPDGWQRLESDVPVG